MGMSLANLQEASNPVGKVMTGTFGKLIGSFAGILLLIKLMSEMFYFVPVGYRGVKLRGGQPIRRRTRRQIGPVVLPRLGPRTGPYKIKQRGVGIKIPFYHSVEKVNIQQRIQVLTPFIAECRDGQRHFNVELVTRIPCEQDGDSYADYPARVVIASSEPDQVFESYTGSALMAILEGASPSQRNNRTWLRDEVNAHVSEDIARVGYLLEGVNLRNRALTSVQVAVNAFGPQPLASSADDSDIDNVVQLPHPVITSAMGLDLSEAQPS